MNVLDGYVTRSEVRRRTGWSYGFIDKYLPRTKIGGKVLISLEAFERLLNKEAADAV